MRCQQPFSRMIHWQCVDQILFSVVVQLGTRRWHGPIEASRLVRNKALVVVLEVVDRCVLRRCKMYAHRDCIHKHVEVHNRWKRPYIGAASNRRRWRLHDSAPILDSRIAKDSLVGVMKVVAVVDFEHILHKVAYFEPHRVDASGVGIVSISGFMTLGDRETTSSEIIRSVAAHKVELLVLRQNEDFRLVQCNAYQFANYVRT